MPTIASYNRSTAQGLPSNVPVPHGPSSSGEEYQNRVSLPPLRGPPPSVFNIPATESSHSNTLITSSMEPRNEEDPRNEDSAVPFPPSTTPITHERTHDPSPTVPQSDKISNRPAASVASSSNIPLTHDPSPMLSPSGEELPLPPQKGPPSVSSKLAARAASSTHDQSSMVPSGEELSPPPQMGSRPSVSSRLPQVSRSPQTEGPPSVSDRLTAGASSSNVPTIVGRPYPRHRGLKAFAYSIISSFMFVTLFCWWSLFCSYIAIALGAAVSCIFEVVLLVQLPLK